MPAKVYLHLSKVCPQLSNVLEMRNSLFQAKGKVTKCENSVTHAERLGVKDNIIFTGYTPDKKLPKLYQAADVFAFSTFYEHHPFAVLEAMATGLPVVTTWVGGIPETIESGKNGFLVEPFNERQFSDRIIYLLEHPSEAAEVGRLARKTIVEQLDWRIVVKEAMAVYDEVLAKQ